MTRPLRYPLQFPVTIEGDSINESPLFSLDGWSALDSNTEIDIVMRMSLNQYTQIASALDVGRDIAYPELSENIWAMFVSRIVSMSLCDSVANCIENSTVVQSSIENYLSNNSTSITTINTRIDSLENATMTTIAPDLCDDRRFGGIRAVIERLDINSIDFLENASDDLRDVFERVDTIIEAIPVFGDIADIMLDFAQSASQDALDEYTAQSTQALKDELACTIFCNTSGCEITIDDVIDAYKRLLPQSFNTAILETLADIVTWFVSGNVQSDTWFALVNLSQLFVIKMVKQFFGFTLPVFKIEYARGSNNPDNTHTLLCSCTSSWSHTIDFTLGQTGGMTLEHGVMTADGASCVYKEWIYDSVNFEFAYNGLVTQFIEYDIEYFRGAVPQAFIDGAWDSSTPYPLSLDVGHVSKYNMPMQLPANPSDNQTLLTRLNTLVNTGGYIKRVTYRGTGTNPFA